jgi:hypothetical protein
VAALLNAAAMGDVRRIVNIISAGVDIDTQNEYGQTPLILACLHGHREAARVLISSGARVSLTDAAGVAPGHLLASQDDPDLAKLLTGLSLQPFTPGSVCHAPSETLSVKLLIGLHESHPGAGAFYVDGAFHESFLSWLETLHKRLPVAPQEKESCNERSYYCDSLGFIQSAFAQVLSCLGEDVVPKTTRSEALSYMRFLHYSKPGGFLAPHVDLSRTDTHGVQSTRTFLLYLTDCEDGGETAILTHLQG